MHQVKINNTVLQLPSQWDELTRHYLELIAGLSTMNLTEWQFKLHLLFHGAGILIKQSGEQPNPQNRKEWLYEVKLNDGHVAHLSASQVADIANTLNFLFKIEASDQGDRKVILDSHLTHNVIYYFKVNGVHYYGPSSKLFNVTLSEFIHCENNMARYVRTKEMQYLDKVIAILYRPQDHRYDPDSPQFKGDRRQPFNDHHIDARARRISKLNHNVKLSIFLFYQGCQWWYQQQFPRVFKKSSAQPENNLGFLNLVDALSGGDVTKIEQIRQSYLMDVMVHLERAAQEYEKLEEKMKKK